MPFDCSELNTYKTIVTYITESIDKPSRAALAKELGLSRTTASNYVNRLISKGIIKELDSESQGRGRPGRPLIPSEKEHYSIGAFFDEHDWYLVITNLQGDIIERFHYPLDRMTIDSFLQILIAAIKHAQKKYKSRLLPAIGIGSPGVIDRNTGTIVKAVDLGWRDIPLARVVKEQTGFDCYVLNRYRTTGLGEALYGKGRGEKDFIFIGIGTGMGSAVILDGKLMFSTNIHTGGIGHIIVDPNGPFCSCGRKGCALPVASEDALVANTIEEITNHKSTAPESPLHEIFMHNNTVTLQDIMTTADTGDQFARSMVEKAADPVCVIIGHLITIINPNRIVLGGPMATAGSYYVEYVSRKVTKTNLTPDIAIVQGSTDVYTGARGAASLVTNQVVNLVFGDLSDT